MSWCSLGTMFLEPMAFSSLPRKQIISLQVLRLLHTHLRDDKDPVSHFLPVSPPLPSLSGQEGMGSTLFLPLQRGGLHPLPPSAAYSPPAWGISCQGWSGRASSPHSEEPGDLIPPGSGFIKPSLSTKCFPVCGHAADTNNHTCHSVLRIPRIPFVVSVGTCLPPEVLKCMASVGRELPKPLDF